MKKNLFGAAALFMLLFVSQCDAQRSRGKQKGESKQRPVPSMAKPAPVNQEQIAWFGTLESARAEAERTEKPIFLISARPECQDVPGKW